jgi:putative oxidoreductase
MKKLQKPICLPMWWQDIIFAIPRKICEYLLTTSFGREKFGLPRSPVDKNLSQFEVALWVPDEVANYGGLFAQFPVFFAWMAAFAEAIGGLLWILGFQTRIASFLILCTMLVAIFMQQINEGMWNCLPALGFLWVSLYCLIIGSGRIGIGIGIGIAYILSKTKTK